MIDIKTTGLLSGIISPGGVYATNPEARALQILAAVNNNLITATVVKQDSKGNAVLQFPSLGELLVQTNVTLKKGEEVVLRLINAASTAQATNPKNSPIDQSQQSAELQIQARVVKVGGKLVSEVSGGADAVKNLSPSLATIILPLTSAKVPNSVVDTSIPIQTLPPVAEASEPTLSSIPARLVSIAGLPVEDDGKSKAPLATKSSVSVPLQIEGTKNFINTPASEGDVLEIQLVRVVPPPAADTDTPNANSITSSIAARGYNAVQQTIAINQTSQAANLQSDAASVRAPNPVLGTLNSVLSYPPEALQRAVIVGGDNTNEYLLRTSFGYLKVPLSQVLPPQTEVEFIALNIKTPSPITQHSEVSEEGRASALTNFFNLVRSIDTEIGTSHTKIVPQPNNQFAARMLWFLHHVEAGTPEAWLGHALKQTLRQADHKDIFQQMGRDALTFRAMSSEGNIPWQGMVIPVFDGEHVQQVKMYRQNGSKRNKKEDSTFARFVIELDMDVFGPLQLDVYFHQEMHVKQLHLHIRSQQEFSDSMQLDIRNLFESAQQMLHQSGSIEFSVSKEFPLKFSELFAPENPNEIIA